MDILVLKYFFHKKKRTILSIMGIAMSIILVVGIGGIGLSFLQSIIEENNKFDGTWHYILYKVNANESMRPIFEKLKSTEHKISIEEGYLIKADESDDYIYAKNVIERAPGEGFSMVPIPDLEGRIPQTSDEIILSSKCKELIESKGSGINKTITFTLAKPMGNEEIKRTFTIVGFYDSAGGRLSAYTCNVDLSSFGTLREEVFLQFDPKKVNDFEEEFHHLAEQYQINEKEFNFVENYFILMMLGQGSEKNTIKNIRISFVVLSLFILFLMGLVIKNSLSISVADKVEQLGILRCLGATKEKIRNIVLKEAFLMWAVAFVSGCLISFAAIEAVIIFIRSLGIGINLKFVLPTEVCIVEGILSFIVIVICSYIPAVRASRVSPVDAVRGTVFLKADSVSRTRKGKLLKMIFRAPGFLASKNIRRNKKRFRSTVFSVMTATVTFIFFTTIISDLNLYIKSYFGSYDCDYMFSCSYSKNKDNEYRIDAGKNLYETIKDVEGVKDSVLSVSYNVYHVSYADSMTSNNIEFISVSKEVYDKYVEVKGVKPSYEDLISKKSGIIYRKRDKQNEEGTFISTDFIKEKVGDTLNFKYDMSREQDIKIKLSIAGEVSSLPWMYYNYRNKAVFIVPDEIVSECNFESNAYPMISVKGKPKYQKGLGTFFAKEIKDNPDYKDFFFLNFYEETRTITNVLRMISLFMTIFISLIVLICIVNLINTIVANLQSRKSEIAILRSIGMNKGELLKMLRLECCLYGIISSIFGALIAYLLELAYLQFLRQVVPIRIGISTFFTMTLISFVGAIVICLLSGRGSINKIVKTSIVDGIRSRE